MPLSERTETMIILIRNPRIILYFTGNHGLRCLSGADERIRGASLIITGEGRVDFQTLTGKTPYGILKRARRQGIPVVAIGGSVALGEKETSEAGFAGVYAVTPSDMPLEEAMKPETAVRNIYDTVKNILNHE